jgi:hypothetical protein
MSLQPRRVRRIGGSDKTLARASSAARVLEQDIAATLACRIETERR